MSGWIKFWKDMPDDPRLLEAAKTIAGRYHLATKSSGGGGKDLSSGDALRFASNALRGALVTLWCYADEHIRNDDTLPMSSDTLDAFVGIEGFFDMIPRDWVTELDNGTVKLPGYCKKNGLIAKEKRASDNKARQAAWRARNEKSNGVTNASHNAIVTRYDAVTKCVDSDSDQVKNKSKSARTGGPDPNTDSVELTQFERLKRAYPKGIYAQSDWLVAEREARRRIDEGHTWDELVAGCERYASQCEAKGSAGTQYVESPKKFFVLPECKFRDAFPHPAAARKSNPGEKSKEQRDAEESNRMRELMASRASRGIPNFRDPYPVESPSAYETALKLEVSHGSRDMSAIQALAAAKRVNA